MKSFIPCYQCYSVLLLQFLFLLFMLWNGALGQSTEVTSTSKAQASQVFENSKISALEMRIAYLRQISEVIGEAHPNFSATHQSLNSLQNQLTQLKGESAATIKLDGVGKQESANGATSSAAQSGALPPVRRARPARMKPVVTDKSFELLGGWQLSSAGLAGKGLGFARGGLYVEPTRGKERLLYTYGHAQASDLYRLKVSLDNYGSDIKLKHSWPTAQPAGRVEQSHVIDSNQPRNVCRPNAGGPMLSTGRVFYATEPGNWVGPWMNWFDDNNTPRIQVAVEPHVDRRQVFGGGFCTVPEWFANEFLAGREFGVGLGGYQSGQGSSPGPSLFVAKRPEDNSSKLHDAIELIGFPWNGSAKAREQRPPDYTTPLWGPAAESGVGWWQADEIVAGPVWIDTPQLTGLCYWSVQGLGKLDYALQDTAFSHDRRVRLYVYDPAMLAEVSQGLRKPQQVRGDFYEWSLPFDTDQNADRWPIGAYWVSGDQLLYMVYKNSGSGQYEVPPAVVIYRIKK